MYFVIPDIIFYTPMVTRLLMQRLVYVLQDNEGQTALHYGKKASLINLYSPKCCTITYFILFFCYKDFCKYVSIFQMVNFMTPLFFLCPHSHLYTAACFLYMPALCPHLSLSSPSLLHRSSLFSTVVFHPVSLIPLYPEGVFVCVCVSSGMYVCMCGCGFVLCLCV